MNTPIYDFLKKYSASDFSRLHMPGHKGKCFLDFQTYSFDITEIKNADSLFEADGIIAQSEKSASELFHTSATYYSAGGSTLCIQTMLSLMKQENRNVIAVRNVHRSFLAGCALLDIEPIWLFPHITHGVLSGEFPYDDAEKLLSQNENSCVYITSPDYLGKIADIEKIAKLCHKYNAVLLVDNAHGAHLIGTNIHPSLLGADLCCDSAHKMLPALTGGAYLHIINPQYVEKAKYSMSLFGSTSPSYLIMASLDVCNKYIAENLCHDYKIISEEIFRLKNNLSNQYNFYDGEPFHLTIFCNGIDLAEQLRQKKIECEYSDSDCIVLLFSPFNTKSDIQETESILQKCNPLPPVHNEKFEYPRPQKIMSVRNAVMSQFETIPVEESLGRICAGVNVPCPPAIPIAACGELIDANCIKIFKRYGILNVNVVK